MSKQNKLSTAFECLSVEVRVDCGSHYAQAIPKDTKQEVNDNSYDDEDNLLESSGDVNLRSNTNFVLTYDRRARPEQRTTIRPLDDNADVESGVLGHIYLITEVRSKIIQHLKPALLL